jgi:hypothetical protein
MRSLAKPALAALAVLFGTAESWARAQDRELFARKIAPLLEDRCLRCHGGKVHKAGLSLATEDSAREGGDSGPAIVPGKPRESLLLDMVCGDKPKMPQGGPRLTAGEVALLRRWIERGAVWPRGLVLRPRRFDGETWWSLKLLSRPRVPHVKQAGWVRTPVDAFVLDRLEREGMTPQREADRRTLIRRLYFDLLGLPPTPEQVEAFVADRSPTAYERLVDRLLSSPHYGERWARHWLDVVHYGDTHGYDKDKVRPNAWPYRDYVVRAFNEDRPYERLVREQLAGDVFYPNTADGTRALGFLAAGPWDFVGQVELREGTLDKAITRNLDRDDMVATVMNTFTGLTVQCARCHDHKFDPIPQEDYYRLQAVFAGVDRADRPFDPDPATGRQRAGLMRRQAELLARQRKTSEAIRRRAGAELATVERRIAEISRPRGEQRPEFGYHSGIEARQDVSKWVQVDLGRPVAIETIVYVGCHDTFNGIGAGFGFPVRYRIDISDDPAFGKFVTVLDQSAGDVPNPGVKPQRVAIGTRRARYVRVTATKLAARANDYIFALAELMVLTPQGKNAAAGAAVTALDSIEAPPRWRKQNLVDGYYYVGGTADHAAELVRLTERRRALLDRATPPELRRELADVERGLRETAGRLAGLPAQEMVHAAATDFLAAGSFIPTKGKPRPIYLLRRGSEKDPVREVGPGTVTCVSGLEARFAIDGDRPESERRAALARWIVDRRNPLTWRSIVNRVWHYHFGRGLVDTPNDFGRMGNRPTHPELLDWLAVEFRDRGQSIKVLHQLIVTSATYRQASVHREAYARLDGGNRLLWRMNRRRLDAEALRDTVLMISGKLDQRLYGPGFRPFGFKDDHSPHYKYDEHDPDDPATLRRSIYRFLVRSVPDPFMETLDCADPSLRVEKRNQTLTALQALALLNNKFMVRMASRLAERLTTMGPDLPGQITAAYRLALGRAPSAEELEVLTVYARSHGLANCCRLILNLNEVSFVD